MLAADVLFADSFESGANSNDWSGAWVEDSQIVDISKTVIIDDATQVEGDSGTTSFDFTVSRLGDASGPTAVDWNTVDDTATGGVDYSPAAGQLAFAAGEMSKTVSISVVGDLDIETDESFFVELSNLSNGTLVDAVGQGTNLTDDVSISISDATVIEGDPGLKFFDKFTPAEFGGLSNTRSAIFGPGGDLFVASKDTDEVLRYDGQTGEFLGVFVHAGSGPLDGPQVLVFDTDDNLYVAGQRSDNVLQYDANGNYIGEYVAAGAFGLDSPRGLLFDADGNLLVSSTTGGGTAGPHVVLRFQGPTGAAPGDPLPSPSQTGAVFVADSGGGLNNPNGLALGPDGQLYVASTWTDSVLRYDAQTGNFLNAFIPANSNGLDSPNFIKFHDGFLYVSSQASDRVLRFDANTGDYVDTIDAVNAAGLDGPFGLDFDSEGNLYVTSAATNEIIRYGDASTAVVQVSLSSPSTEKVTANYATSDGSDPGGADQGSDYVSQTGVITIPLGIASRSILVSTIADATSELSETLQVDLTVSINATVADGSGTVTIEERGISIGDATVTEGDIAPATHFATADNATANFNTLAFGPDGDLFVEIGGDTPLANSILRFDETTGVSEGVFISNDQFNTTRDLLFRDGVLYVADLDADQVKIFDAATGSSLGVFVGDDPATPNIDESGGLVGPEGMTFGPDGNNDGESDLYVAGWRSNNILRYDGMTGAYIDTLVTGLSAPTGLEYYSGSLFVTNQTNEILEFDSNGSLLRSIGSASDGLSNPLDIAISPDEGYLYVTSGHTSKVIRYDLGTGYYIDDFATAEDGLDYTRSLTFYNGALYVTSINNDDVVRFATRPEAVFSVSLSDPARSRSRLISRQMMPRQPPAATTNRPAGR